MTHTPSTPESGRRQLEELLARTYFASTPDGFLETEAGRFLMNQHVWERYEQARDRLAVWVDKAGGLRNRRVVEIGSGTGSSAAGFAISSSASSTSTARATL